MLPAVQSQELLMVTGKDGRVYLLDRNHLGHWSRALDQPHVFSGESKCAPAYFQSDIGPFVYLVGSGTPGLIAFRIQSEAGVARLVHGWRGASSGIELGDGPGSPVVSSGPTQVILLPSGSSTIAARGRPCARLTLTMDGKFTTRRRRRPMLSSPCPTFLPSPAAARASSLVQRRALPVTA
jgi:hypothetical protein